MSQHTQEKVFSRAEWIKAWGLVIVVVLVMVMASIATIDWVERGRQTQAKFEQAEPQDRADFEKIFGAPAVVPKDYSEIAKRVRHAKVKAGLLALVELRIKQVGELEALWKLDANTDAEKREKEILALEALIKEAEMAYTRREFLAHRFVHLFNSENRPKITVNSSRDMWWWMMAKRQIESAPIELAYD